MILGSARLHVCAHEQKRLIVALKYPGEEDYRYLVASDLSWRTIDIASAYTLPVLSLIFLQAIEFYGHKFCFNPDLG